MTILVYGLNYSPELVGTGKYTAELCNHISKKANQKIIVVTAVPYYPQWSVYPKFKNWYSKSFEDGVLVYRCPLYVPKAPSTLKRLVHLASFAISSFPVMLMMFGKKISVTLVIAPTFFCVPLGLVFCKISKSRAHLHIQDFELEAMRGLQMSRGSTYRNVVLDRIEKNLLKRFSLVSTISNSMRQKLLDKGLCEDNTALLPNWVDCKFFRPLTDVADRNLHFDFDKDTQIVLYSGNVGEKQGLELIIELAKKYEKNRKVVFLIVGEGPKRAELEQKKSKFGLTNLVFSDFVSYEDLPELLNMATVHLILQRKGVRDSALPSKLTSILGVGGGCIVAAEIGTELELIFKNNPGIYRLVQPESIEQLKNALDSELENSEKGYNEVARNFAMNNLSSSTILDKFTNILT